MAVGVRITSENLNGKSATVEFLPLSGSSQNLGTKTIPFNNIDLNPYGTYLLHFNEYDYTYSLDVPFPTNQTAMFVNEISGSSNYGFLLQDFHDVKATIIDLDVDSNIWYANNLYVVHDSGYMIEFRGENNSNDRNIFFLDLFGNVVENYIAYDISASRNSVDGKWAIIRDYTNGVFKYFNGKNVYTYNWNTTYEQFNIEWNNYGIAGDYSLLFSIQNTNTDTRTLYSAKQDGTVVEVESWDVTLWQHTYMIGPEQQFIYRERHDVNNGYNISEVKLFGLDGSTLQTINVIDTWGYYDNYNYTSYKNNKFCIVYYSNDVNQQYLILHYDGNTNTLIQNTHSRGTNYESMWIEGNDNYYPNNREAGSLFITFYSQSTWKNLGPLVNYYDIVYMLENQTAFTTYTFEDGNTAGTKVIEGSGNGGKIATRLFVDTNSPTIKVLSITPTGVNTHDTGINRDVDNWSMWYYNLIDRRAVFSIDPYSDYTDGSLFLIKADGSIGNVIALNGPGSWSWSATNAGYSFYITNMNGTAYYLNTTHTDFGTITGDYNSSNNTYYKEADGFNPSSLIIYNGTNIETPTGRFLTKNTISREITFPQYQYGQYNLYPGKDHVLYVYRDSGSGLINIRLYDKGLNLLRSLETPFSNYDFARAANDRFYVRINPEDGTLYYYMITPHSIVEKTMSANGNWYDAPNDYFNWND